MSIDSREAASALSDIDAIVRRVRQSRIYDHASLMMVMWGVLVFVANIASFTWPRSAGYFWLNCALATASEKADSPIPVESRRLIRVHVCLHR